MVDEKEELLLTRVMELARLFGDHVCGCEVLTGTGVKCAPCELRLALAALDTYRSKHKATPGT